MQGSLEDLVVSPDGQTVYGTGQLDPQTGEFELVVVTLALSADKGRIHWRSSLNPPGVQLDTATDIALASDGSSVYVTGNSPEVIFDPEFSIGPGDAVRLSTRLPPASCGGWTGATPRA